MIPTGDDQTNGFYHLVENEEDAKLMAAETGGFEPFAVDMVVK